MKIFAFLARRWFVHRSIASRRCVNSFDLDWSIEFRLSLFCDRRLPFAVSKLPEIVREYSFNQVYLQIDRLIDKNSMDLTSHLAEREIQGQHFAVYCLVLNAHISFPSTMHRDLWLINVCTIFVRIRKELRWSWSISDKTFVQKFPDPSLVLIYWATCLSLADLSCLIARWMK